MPLRIGWTDILIRLFWTLVAGFVVGLNRVEGNRPAGLRTVMLVCVAASVAMIQVNLLLVTVGKTPDNFNVMDLMRLPLGILSGMGFIGAGAILHGDNLVRGVTTAATLWLVTVIGLCLGGGQIALGMATTLLALFILTELKKVERYLHRRWTGMLHLTPATPNLTEEDISRLALETGYQAVPLELTHINGRGKRRFGFKVTWDAKATENKIPSFIKRLDEHADVEELEWKSQAAL